MNAGAMGWEIYDLVEWVFLLPDGTIKQISGNQLDVGYRHLKRHRMDYFRAKLSRVSQIIKQSDRQLRLALKGISLERLVQDVFLNPGNRRKVN